MNQAAGAVVIAGGSGFLGRSLAAHLHERGMQVVVLARGKAAAGVPWSWVRWDARTPGDWMQALDGAAAVVNLVGRSVDCIKTPDHQDEILRSRVEATRVLGVAMQQLASPPAVWMQMSTSHIYGDPPSTLCTEESSTGYGLAPFVGRAWEAAYEEGALPEQRRVVLRTSFVIGRNRGAGGGALQKVADDRTLRLGRQDWLRQTGYELDP